METLGLILFFVLFTLPIIEKEVMSMSLMKRWFEDHIDELSDEDIFAFGCETQEEVDFLRDCFTTKNRKNENELT